MALDKATVTADDYDLCDTLRYSLGDAAGPPTLVAQFLGVDNLLGRRRSILARDSKWSAGAKAAIARRNRLRKINAGLANGSTKVFIAGVQAAATYGAEVLGIAKGELDQLQKTALSAMTPSTRGRSKTALFVARGDPTWRPATAPILRWAQ